jgi:hypothetical protein
MSWTPRSTFRWLTCALAISGIAGAAAEPCKLLTVAQVSTALGVTVGAGQPIGTTGCSWASAKPHEVVTLSLWPPAQWDRLKAGGALPGTTNTPVSGLGDGAFYTSIVQYEVLYVKKADTVYLFKVYGVADKAKQMSTEKTLALQVMQAL